MRVVIVGGGFAGIKAALELNNVGGVEVTLVSKNSEFEYHGVSHLSPSDIVIPIADLFASSNNISVVKDTAVALNARVNAIKGDSGQIYRYDNLLLCLGRNKHSYSIPGVEKYTFGINTMQDVRQLYNGLLESLKSTHRQTIRVIIVGGGPSGVEIAGAMQDYALMVSRRYGVKQKHIEVEVIESAPRLLPRMLEVASAKAKKRLEQLGVTVRVGSKVVGCSQNSVQLASGTERVADIIVWAAGSEPVGFFEKYPELFSVVNGHVEVDGHLRVPKAQNVYVLGDCAEALYRGMAQSSLRDAEHVTKQLVHPSKNEAAYQLEQPPFVIPIGEKWALIQKNGRVVSGRYGWLTRKGAQKILNKHLLHLKKVSLASK